MEEAVQIKRGTGPIVLGIPHAGTYLPSDIYSNLTPAGKMLTDTDWLIDKLYEDLLSDITTVKANFHRYVIDANRDPLGISLYPGKNTTTLVPLTDFTGTPLWLVNPSADEITQRVEAWHKPYHDALASELERVLELHGACVLYDCHSIRSKIPFLFQGTLPDFNIGTNRGASCSLVLEKAVREVCAEITGYSTVVNGRFIGGWTTRHYGSPLENIHAIQMELTQKTYLEKEAMPFEYDNAKATTLQNHLRKILQKLSVQVFSLNKDTE